MTRGLHGRILPNIQRGTYAKPFKLFQKVEEEGTLPKTFYDAASTIIPKPDKDTTKEDNY